MRNAPASPISHTVATNGSSGSGSRLDRNEPSVQDIVALIITASPSAVEPLPRPGRDHEPEADEPRERAQPRGARRVLAGEQAQDDDLQRHRPGDHRRDARVDPRLGDVDDADAEREEQPAGERARSELGARDAERRPAPREDRREQDRCGQEARAGGEQRRQRLDRDLDREVGRAPDARRRRRARSRRASRARSCGWKRVAGDACENARAGDRTPTSRFRPLLEPSGSANDQRPGPKPRRPRGLVPEPPSPSGGRAGTPR